MGVLVIVAGVSAIVVGFTNNSLNRVFPIAFGMAAPILYAVVTFAASEQLIMNFENLVIALDFNTNSRFEFGTYTLDHISRSYGTKVCADLSYEILIAPHPEGGYIVAVPRKSPAKLRNGNAVLATGYLYNFVPQEQCKTINEFSEERND